MCYYTQAEELTNLKYSGSGYNRLCEFHQVFTTDSAKQ